MDDPSRSGPEAMEIIRHAEWASDPARLHHHKRDREDVDLVGVSGLV